MRNCIQPNITVLYGVRFKENSILLTAANTQIYVCTHMLCFHHGRFPGEPKLADFSLILTPIFPEGNFWKWLMQAYTGQMAVRHPRSSVRDGLKIISAEKLALFMCRFVFWQQLVSKFNVSKAVRNHLIAARPRQSQCKQQNTVYKINKQHCQ